MRRVAENAQVPINSIIGMPMKAAGDARPNASPKDSFWRGSSGRATMMIAAARPGTKNIFVWQVKNNKA